MIRLNPLYIIPQIAVLLLALNSLGLSQKVADQDGVPGQSKLTKCSEFRSEIPFSGMLAANSRMIFTGMVNGGVYALEPSELQTVWRSELGGEIASNIISEESGLLIISNPVQVTNAAPAESLLRSLSKETGVPNWTVRLPFSEKFYIRSFAGSVIVVNLHGAIVSVEPQIGRVNWRTPAVGKLNSHPSFSSHGISLATHEKQIFMISYSTGGIIYKGTSDFVTTAITNPAADVIVTGDNRGNVASISVPSGKNIWKFKSGGSISFVSVTEAGLYITSLDNFIYLISMYNGDVIWKRRLPGRVTEGSLFVEGFVLVPIYGENSVFLIEAKNGQVIDQLAPNPTDFVSQVPVALKDGRVVMTTAESVAVYALNGCGQK